MTWASKAALIGVCLLAAGSGVALGASPAHAQEAEVTLRLGNPVNPEMLMLNKTGVAAEGIRYATALWNADNMQDGYKMLPIPGGSFRSLSPYSALEPVKLFDAAEVRAWLKPGNRIVGTVAVNCRNCSRGYTYRILITWGEGGWFAEIEGMTSGGLIVPRYTDSDETMRGADLKGAILQMVSEVDPKTRSPIGLFVPPSDGTLTPQANTPAR